MKRSIAVISGRFQVLHKQHLEYIQLAMNNTEHLIIGITNQNPIKEVGTNQEDPNRTNIRNNPFTYYERYMMIKNTMLEEGYLPEQFDIVPFPIEEPYYLKNYLPKNAIHFLTIFDDWGRKKKQILEDAGFLVEVLKDCPFEDKYICSTHIRKMISDNQEWKHLVPYAVFKYIVENKLDQRIKSNR